MLACGSETGRTAVTVLCVESFGGAEFWKEDSRQEKLVTEVGEMLLSCWQAGPTLELSVGVCSGDGTGQMPRTSISGEMKSDPDPRCAVWDGLGGVGGVAGGAREHRRYSYRRSKRQSESSLVSTSL